MNVSDLDASVHFYCLALAPLGFQKADGEKGQYARLTDELSSVIVLCPAGAKHRDLAYHRKAIGLGHFALAVESKDIVDQMAEHLATLGVPLLGEGKIELGYRRGYYTLAFEDPDRIMIEIVYHDPYYFSLAPP
ncbi:MAG: VOC family protein [Kofleriaceae bacterium]|nr:VOC family protein [Kofleriaceae bacterium]